MNKLREKVVAHRAHLHIVLIEWKPVDKKVKIMFAKIHTLSMSKPQVYV